MLLDLLIKINRTKLDDMISNHADYEMILKQSQKLDKLISKKTVEIIKEKNNKKV